MNNQFGELISDLRAKYGFTQKELANKLFVSDKAVSKWERGICLPDISSIRRLSVIFDIDIETLLLGKTNSNNNSWIGIINVEKNAEISLNSIINDKPLVFILISYFLLANITEIIIRCSLNEYDELIESVSKIRGRINIIVITAELQDYLQSNYKELKNKNIMLIQKMYFIFGAGLTYAFQKAMNNDGKYTTIVSPCTDISDEKIEKERNYILPKYRDVPIVFANYEAIKCLAEMRVESTLLNKHIESINRGFIEININNMDKLNDVEKMITCIERYGNMKVYDPKYIMKHK